MNSTQPTISWTEANQAYLVAEFARLKKLLGLETTEAEPRAEPPEPPAAIDHLCELFGLSHFERQVLLLCAGVEMDSELAGRCGENQGGQRQPCVTFGFALAALDSPHWTALTPDRPLRRFRLLEMEKGRGLTSAPLRIDERILHYLAGVNLLDSRLERVVEAGSSPDSISDEHKLVATQVVQVLETRGLQSPVIHLCGDDAHGQEDVAGLAAEEVGLRVFILRVDDQQAAGPELDQLDALWQREALLTSGALLIQCGTGGLAGPVRHLVERLPAPLILASEEPVRLNRPFLRFEVNKPRPAEQRRLWQAALGPAAEALNGTLDRLSAHFRLSVRAIQSVASLVDAPRGLIDPDGVWNACRSLSRPRLEDLAQRIVPTAGWDDLVLPDAQMQTLRHLASQARHRLTVCESWGFSAKGRRGLGLSALFAGESGTGKTLAAEVLARDLSLDLYRIDLSAVVSKYIGETEKNLKRVFDAAEDGGALLLFDEADALFGKRGDVKDSHDRYANIEVSYLLQRMEAYQGVAILTTNLKASVDRSFHRRLRFTVNFPFPDASQREAIWSRIFPAETPTHGLVHRMLAQLNVAGGNIRSIAVNAAFLAADSGKPVDMGHVLQAARLEAQKIERPLSDAEIRGWL